MTDILNLVPFCLRDRPRLNRISIGNQPQGGVRCQEERGPLRAMASVRSQ